MPSSVDRGANDWPSLSAEVAVDPAHTSIGTHRPAPILRTLIVDNYDSYTFNLLQLFDKDQLEHVVVIRNDQVEWYGHQHGALWSGSTPVFFLETHRCHFILILIRSRFEQEVLPYFDQVVLSPGPGRPERKEVRNCGGLQQCSPQQLTILYLFMAPA